MLKKDKVKYNQTFYYKDELNDDFEENTLERIPVPENYQYIKKNPFYRFFSNALYYCIAVPVLFLVSKCYGIKVKGKKNLKLLNKRGCFIYANHTSFLDAFDIQALVFNRKKTYVLAYTDSLSNKFLAWITPLLGYLPLPDSPKSFRNFNNAVNELVLKKNCSIIIYPEAHIWPFYTKIRPFISTSFKYPAKINVPVLPVTTCYRKSKISKHAKITLVVGKPIFPKPELSVNENKEYLRDECYRVLSETAEKYSNYQYVKYVKKEEDNEKKEERN